MYIFAELLKIAMCVSMGLGEVSLYRTFDLVYHPSFN